MSRRRSPRTTRTSRTARSFGPACSSGTPRASWPSTSCRCRGSRRTGTRGAPCPAPRRCAGCARRAPGRRRRRTSGGDGDGRARDRRARESECRGRLGLALSTLPGMADTLLDDLLEWLRIPSISTGGGDPAELERAAAWSRDKVRNAGGEAELVRIGDGNPLVIGDLRAADPDAPTVLIYGHYDVQGEGDLALWQSPPFEPDVRDGRVFARGAADDKGNFWPLLHAACELARAGELPVNVRVAVEGEEEVGSASIARWLADDERGADGAIVYDSGMVDPQTPAITVGLRGVFLLTFDVRAAGRDLHSGMFGGSALNSLHALHRMLAAVLPGEDGRVREELRVGIVPPTEDERAAWAALPAGEDTLAAAGARPAYPGAGAEYVERNGSDASLDVDQIR